MKRIQLLLLALLSVNFAFAQAPDYFKYQSIARNASGTILANTTVGLRISVRDLSAAGTIVFQETHTATTNDYGLFTISIGAGTPSLGTIQGVGWAGGPKYVEIEGDLSGGTNYTSFGTSQLLSVPYALYANNAGTAFLPAGTAIGNTTWWNGGEWVIYNNNLFNAGGFVGIATNTPEQRLDVNGNINIPMDSAYMIDNRRMFWIKANNIFIGDNAGDGNFLGTSNSFFGTDAGVLSSVGSQNTYLGTETGRYNVAGNMGTFVGNRAGFNNTIGNENTYIGAYAGQFNTEGQHNSFVGVTTGNNNTTGNENTFVGAHAGYFNTSGSFNTLIGNFAGENSDMGNYNTALGFEADFISSNLLNATALGAGAIATASNSVIVGNTSVTSIGGQVGWSTLSDRRLKTDIQANQLGLNFINRLNTVNYMYTTPGQEGIRYSGLIAQDVEALALEMGVDFSGVVRPTNPNSYYSIRYAEFVVPLIKAVQEQSSEIKDLNTRITELEAVIKTLLEKE